MDNRARAESVGVGVRLALATALAGWIYAFATWNEANRRPLVLVFALWAVLALGASLVSRERMVAGGWREPFFLLWSAASIGLTSAVVAIDGGTGSALVFMFFLPVAFAALSYPAGAVVAVAVADYLAYVAVDLLGTGAGVEQLCWIGFTLASVAAMCVWQADAHVRRREALAHVSRADPLTGCLNRRGFEERLDAELSRAARTGRPLGVVMLDLGTPDAGAQPDTADELLEWALQVMGDAVRPMDSIGRIEELRFAIVAPGAGRDDSAAIARRLRDALGERAPASAGVACFPADGVDREELERHAERELDLPGVGSHRSRWRHERRGSKELSWATALARAVDERMSVHHEHSWRVAELGVGIAHRLGWPESQMELLRMAAILHDVGKVTVPDHVLRKREPLTEREWEAIKRSPVRGAEMVGRIQGLEEVVPWIRHSHERFDGSGYPSGLSGDKIPPACRVIHVADAFDSMVSGRPYRPPINAEEALAELRLHAGTQFDPECVERLEDYLYDEVSPA